MSYYSKTILSHPIAIPSIAALLRRWRLPRSHGNPPSSTYAERDPENAKVHLQLLSRLPGYASTEGIRVAIWGFLSEFGCGMKIQCGLSKNNSRTIWFSTLILKEQSTWWIINGKICSIIFDSHVIHKIFEFFY